MFADFLASIDTNIIKVIALTIMLVCVIIEFVSTGSIKKSLKIMKEVNNMTFNERQKVNAKLKGEEFSEMVDDLQYNEDTKIVEKVGEKNIQDFIQSSLSTSLDVFLQRFSDDGRVEDKPLQVATGNQETAYDAMLNAAQVAEEYAKAHGLENASFIDIMKAINNEHKQQAQPVKEQEENEKAQTIDKEEQA